MKKSEFKILIREIVREEVRMELRKQLKEYKLNERKPIVQRKKPNKKQYTNNKLLNDVLNETANSDEWETMSGEAYTTNNMNDVLSKEYNGQVEDIPSSLGVSTENTPDHVINALTKDYRGLMKAIDKKKNGAPL